MKPIRSLVNVFFDVLGFHSVDDFMKSTIGLKHEIVIKLYILAISFGGVMAIIQNFIAKYVYSPEIAVILIFLLTLLDVVFGMNVAIKEKIGISPSRIGRAFVKFFVQMIFIAFLYQFSKIWGTFFQAWIVDAAVILCGLIVFWSALKNAKILGIVSKELYEVIESILSLKSIVERIKRK